MSICPFVHLSICPGLESGGSYPEDNYHGDRYKAYFIRDVCVPSVRVKDSSPLNPGCVRLPRLASRIVKDCRLPFSERFHGDETVLVLYGIR